MKKHSKDRDWFVKWFDSPYYHILYSHRNEEEGKKFLNKLCHQLKLKGHESILDLGCGKGRHSVFLASKGFSVLGIDLSPSSIAHAIRQSSENLSFQVGDMRSFKVERQQDVVMNLFTSFGYFESQEENLKVLNAVKTALKEGAVLVLDYFNLQWVRDKRIETETIVKENIAFHIKRYEEDGQVIKEISFEHESKSHHHTERVQALSPQTLQALLEEAGFSITGMYGNYDFDPLTSSSERCLLIAHT